MGVSVDFLVINPRSRLDGHPLILGRPWLAIANAYIGYREGSMTITNGDAIKNMVLYPPTRLGLPIVKICKRPPTYLEESIRSPLTVAEELEFKNQTKDDIITNVINQPTNVECEMLKAILDNEAMEDPLRDTDNQHFETIVVHNNK